MVQKTRRAAPAKASPDDGDATVNRNFALPVAQAEWLRDAAYEHRLPQAQLVREAIADLQRKYARKKPAG